MSRSLSRRAVPGSGNSSPGKNENDISSFVAEWHSIGRRNPFAPPIRRTPLGTHRSTFPSRRKTRGEELDHRRQLRLRPFARHFCDETDNSRHISLRRLLSTDSEFAVIPSVPEFAEFGLRVREDGQQTSRCRPSRKATRPRASQRDVVARQIDALKTVAFLEVTDAVWLLFPVGEVRVYEIRDPSFGTGSDGLCDQRIGRSLSLCWIMETMFIRSACVRVSSVTSLTKPISLSPKNAPMKMLLSRNVASSLRTVSRSFP